jgi:hypothetical protein
LAIGILLTVSCDQSFESGSQEAGKLGVVAKDFFFGFDILSTS